MATCALAIVGCVPISLDLQQRKQLRTFDRIWERFESDYPYFDEAGISWHSQRKQFRAAAAYAKNEVEFVHLLAGMLMELDDPHVSIRLPEGYSDGLTAPSIEFTVVDQSTVLVTKWPEGLWVPPPFSAVLQHDTPVPELIAIDGHPVSGNLWRRLLLGYPETIVELDLRWNSDVLSRVQLRRPPLEPTGVPEQPAANGSAPAATEVEAPDEEQDVPAEIARDQVQLFWFDLDRLLKEGRYGEGDEPSWSLDDESNLALHLQIRALQPMGGLKDLIEFEDYIDAITARVTGAIKTARNIDCRCILIDLRGNQGGYRGAASAISSLFIREDFRSIQNFRPLLDGWLTRWLLDLIAVEDRLVAEVEPQAGIGWSGPLVVLVDHTSASAAEALARQLQRAAGAIVVGTQTAGAEAGIVTVKGHDGLEVIFGAATKVESSGRGLQGTGVVPNVSVSLPIHLLNDRGAIEQAIEREPSTSPSLDILRELSTGEKELSEVYARLSGLQLLAALSLAQQLAGCPIEARGMFGYLSEGPVSEAAEPEGP